MCERLRVPVDCRELADVVAREHGNIHRSGEFGAAALVRLLERCDALRKPQRFADVLLACECDARGRLGLRGAALSAARAAAARRWRRRSRSTRPRSRALAAERGLEGPAIGEAIQRARVEAVVRITS